MNPTGDEAGRREPPALALAVQGLYESVGGVLLRFLKDRFRLSEKEAQAVLCGACYAALRLDLRDRETWTIGYSCNSARTLRRWHDEGTVPPPPDVTLEELEALRGVVLVSQALATLTESGREALRLRFRKQRSYAEIAAELDISTRYAEQLVFRSLQRLRARQRVGDEEPDR